jgi:hypothetical protein
MKFDYAKQIWMKFDYDRMKFDCNVRFNLKFDYIRLKLTKFDII